jgi:hypothetical protein
MYERNNSASVAPAAPSPFGLQSVRSSVLRYFAHEHIKSYFIGGLIADWVGRAATLGVAGKPYALCEACKSLIPQGFTPSR